MKKNLIFSVFLTLLSLSNYAQGGVEFDIPNSVGVYKIHSIGQGIQVYKSSIENKFYYQPVLIVDWRNYKSQIDKCIKNTTMVVGLKIDMVDDRIEAELMSQLKVDGYIVKSLSPLLHTDYRIEVKFGNGKLIYTKSDFLANTSITPGTLGTLPSPYNAKIEGNCEDLNKLYQEAQFNETIIGYLLSDGYIYTSDVISGFSEAISDRKFQKDLFGDEERVRYSEITTKSKSRGWGLKFGLLSGGGGSGKSKVSTKYKDKRIVSRDYISAVVDDHKSNLQLVVNGNTERTKELLDKFITQLTSYFKNTSVTLEKINNDEYKAITDLGDYVTIKPEGVKEILNAKPDLSQNFQNKEEGSYDGVTVKNENSQKYAYKDDIKWEFVAGDWIPTKVDMKIASKSSINAKLEIGITLFNEGKAKSIGTKFVYPALWCYNQSKGPSVPMTKDNPIGSIISFAGPLESMPKNGWRICNGDTLSVNEYPKLFKAIGFSWGKIDDEHFKVPSLQGYFLRGIDYSGGIEDPDINSRLNAQKEPYNGVGSYQQDSFQQHVHYVGVGKSDKSANSQNRDRFIDFQSENDGPFSTGDPAGRAGEESPRYSKETRPKNAYVHFIIRVN